MFEVGSPAGRAQRGSMLSRRAVICWLSLTVLLAGCERKRESAHVKPVGLIKIVIQCDDAPRAELGGFYQALARGYYQQAGLEVEIQPGSPAADVCGAVSESRADYGLARSDDVIVAASLGRPLQMVAASRQHDPLALLVHERSPISTTIDLKGQTVYADEGHAWSARLQRERNITFTLKPPLPLLAGFLATENAIQAGYVTSDLFAARHSGVKVRALALGKSSHDSYHVIFCRQLFARQNPGAVHAFVKATLRGWGDFLENDPSPAFTLILRLNHASRLDLLEHARGELILGQFVTGDPAQGESLGALSFDRLRSEVDLLLELGVIAAPVSVNAIATKEYLSENLP